MNDIFLRWIISNKVQRVQNTLQLELSLDANSLISLSFQLGFVEAEFKEFQPRLQYGNFHLNLYLIFQLKPVFGGFKTWLKFIKFGHTPFIFQTVNSVK